MKQRSHLAVAFLAALGLGSFAVSTRAAAATIDTFDDGSVSDWTEFASSGSSVYHRLSSSRANTATTSMKIEYSLATGGYGGLEKRFTTRPDWSTGTRISVWVYGLLTQHRFGVQIYDAGGERWETSFVVDFTGWKNVVLPFSSFTRVGLAAVGRRLEQRARPARRSGHGAPAARGQRLRGRGRLPRHADGLGQRRQHDDVDLDSDSATAPAPSTSAGMIVPLYSYPSSPAWTSLKAAKAANPTVPILAVVNPANGPNTAVDQNYAIGIQQLVAAGIKVIGYVHTSYGARAVASVNTDVDRWKALYPQVTGIFFDEMSNTTGKEQYYKDINAYAKTGRGYGVTIGNPGADSLPSYVGTVDIILVYESSGLPPLAMLDGWHKSYDPPQLRHHPVRVPDGRRRVHRGRQAEGRVHLPAERQPAQPLGHDPVVRRNVGFAAEVAASGAVPARTARRARRSRSLVRCRPLSANTMIGDTPHLAEWAPCASSFHGFSSARPSLSRRRAAAPRASPPTAPQARRRAGTAARLEVRAAAGTSGASGTMGGGYVGRRGHVGRRWRGRRR
jgi:hypothetical protein